MKHDRIEVNREIMLGKPVIRGTRITVQQVIDELAGGMSIAEILEAHPHLVEDDIAAAQQFAAEYISEAAE